MNMRICCFRIKKTVFFLFFLYFSIFLYCIDYFEEGKRFLAADQPDKAIPVLFTASKDASTDSSVFLYLGVAYLRAGKYPEALNYFSEGQKKDPANSYFYSYNTGNIYFMQNRFDTANVAYSASIDANVFFAPAFLNRANTRMKLADYKGALHDYKNYLQLQPHSMQRASINKLVSLLEDTLAEAERLRALQEAKKAAEEAERLASEQRYKQLVDDVNSNFSSLDDADSVSAGADGTIDYSEENELD